MSVSELEGIYKLVSYCVLSRISHECYVEMDDGRKISIGNLLQFTEILVRQKGTVAKVSDRGSGKIYYILYKKLWQQYKDILLYLFGYAQEEALHMSAESRMRERPSSHDFSSLKDRHNE